MVPGRRYTRRTWVEGHGIEVCVCDERSYLSDERVNEVWALILSFLSRELISMWCVECVEVKADARDGVSSTTVCVRCMRVGE